MTKLDKKPDGVTATIDDGKGGTADARGRARHLGRRRRRQYRESRPREARREDRRAAPSRSINSTAPTCPASMRSATWPARRMLAHKAEHEGVICVEAIKGLKPHPMDKRLIPGLHLLLAADRLGRTDRAGRQGEEARHPRRPLSVRRQRQGDRARRGPGTGQGDLRQDDRRSCSAPTWSAPRSPS